MIFDFFLNSGKGCIGVSKSLSNVHIIIHHYQFIFQQLSNGVFVSKWNFKFHHMIFNIPQRTVRLNPASGVMKIMWKSWNNIVMEIQYLTAIQVFVAYAKQANFLLIVIWGMFYLSYVRSRFFIRWRWAFLNK